MRPATLQAFAVRPVRVLGHVNIASALGTCFEIEGHDRLVSLVLNAHARTKRVGGRDEQTSPLDAPGDSLPFCRQIAWGMCKADK